MTTSPPGARPAASLGRRVGAFAIDTAIAYAIGAVLIGITVGVVVAVGPAWQPESLALFILLAYAVIALVLLAWMLVYAAMQGGRGSIGQRALHVRLLDAATGGPIGLWRAVWRNIVFAASCAIAVGYFTPLFDQSGRRQGWHDLAAKAVVVGTGGAVAVPMAAYAVPAARPAAVTTNPYLPPSGVPGGMAPPTGAPVHLAPPTVPLPTAGYLPVADDIDGATELRPSAAPGWTTQSARAAGVSAPANAARAGAPSGVIAEVPWHTSGAPETPAVAKSPVWFPEETTPFPAATTTEPLDHMSALFSTPAHHLPDATPVAAPPAPAPAPVAAPVLAPVITPVPAPAPAVIPAPLAPAIAGGAASPASFAGDDVEATRMAVAPPAQRAALYPDAPVIAVLTWDEGTRMAVYGRTLYGRNPAGEAGAVAIAVRDETLSLSKTHFEIGGDPATAWIVDRHSTNGTILVRDGVRIPLVAGARTNLRAGDRLEFGDRAVTVGAA